MSNSLLPHGLQPTGSAVHGLFQAGILKWVAISSSRGTHSHVLPTTEGFPGSSVVKIYLPIQKTQVQSLGQEDSLEEEMATHSIILSWKIPWTEEPSELWSKKLKGVRHD